MSYELLTNTTEDGWLVRFGDAGAYTWWHGPDRGRNGRVAGRTLSVLVAVFPEPGDARDAMRKVGLRPARSATIVALRTARGHRRPSAGSPPAVQLDLWADELPVEVLADIWLSH